MSGQLVSAVLESALSPDLKFTAVVFASFADEAGYRMWPAVDQVAYLRGVSGRQVQVHVKELLRMQIFAIVKPATQHFPAHYRLLVDQLPARPPFRASDPHTVLLPLGGESPEAFVGGSPPGVKPASPQPGVKWSAPGVKWASPDPPLDPPRTHTYDARARAVHGAEVKPASPLTAAVAGAKVDTAPRLPLVLGPVRDPDHAAHSFCGRICVPRFLHKQFRKALGGPVSRRAARLRTFYAETLEALPAARPIGEEPLKFWRTAFAARFGGAAPRRINGAGTGALDHDYMTVWDRRLAQRSSGS
jgi:hypothetical protein